MFSVSVGLDQASAALRKLAAVTANATELLAGPVDAAVSQFAEEQFASEGATAGTRWAGHTAITERLRARPGHGRGGIGRDTNRLWASLVKSQGPDAIRRLTSSTLERGTTVPYARFFFGGYTQTQIFGRERHSPRATPGRPVFPNPMPASFERSLQRLASEFYSRKVST